MPEAPRCLHAWLRQTARTLPDRIAVEGVEGAITTHELYERARRLAAAMIALGVSRGARVGVVSEKSVDAITAIFGTLMAGATYVPLPLSWPQDRVESTLERSQATLTVIAGDSPQEGLTLVSRATGRALAWSEAIAGAPIDESVVDADPESAALLLFTSGSTGVPKGVTLSHRAVEAFVRWACDAFSVCPADRLFCPASLSFDLSTLDVFSVAIRGAACVVMPETAVWMPKLVTRFAQRTRATIWYSVPSILMQMLDGADLEGHPVDSLRAILFAGEVMPSVYAARLRATYPTAQLWNLYGPTETNVVTAHRLGDRVDATLPLPIGRACPYATLRLDPRSIEATEDGRSGELLVAGASLMSGYWDAPSETARALTRLEGEGDGPFYRTGDRVLEGPDGTYRFLGRVDRQVKRRGVRIELGEIEAALFGTLGVAEVAAVAVAKDGATNISIFATPLVGERLAPGDLRARCARVLPSYMMPDTVQVLEHLPRNSRGKVDYAALTAICRRHSERGD